jgi:3,5-epimerase/4-reductase
MAAQCDYMIVGKTGWIANKMKDMMEEKGLKVVFMKSRMQNTGDVSAELDEVKPKWVICAAGLTGRPNVDWCEDHKQEVIRVNVIGTLALIDLCYQKGIHITNFATGCIFKYDDEHKIGGKLFTEEDDGNFEGSFYSMTKGLVERMIRFYPNCLTFRVRMPISDDLIHRNFVTKITTYDRVVDIPNSMTILHDMLPIALKAAQRKLTGIYNFTNPGPISHNEILEMYKEIIDPTFTWKNFTEEEQNKILKAERSNNTLCMKKLCAEFPGEIPEIKQAMRDCFLRMKVNLDKEAGGKWNPDLHPKKKARKA